MEHGDAWSRLAEAQVDGGRLRDRFGGVVPEMLRRLKLRFRERDQLRLRRMLRLMLRLSLRRSTSISRCQRWRVLSENQSHHLSGKGATETT